MLDDWAAQVCRVLDLEPGVVDTREILDLARDAAHHVARPAAPLTAYLVGVAVGKGRTRAEAIEAVAGLIQSWPAPAGQ